MWGLSVGPTTHLGKQEVQKHQHNASDNGRNKRNRQWQSKKEMRFGTWNTRTLAVPGAIDILSKELSTYKMDVVALQETRWPLAGKLNTKEYIIYYSGNDEGRYQRGVGFAVHKKIVNAVIGFEALGERLCKIRIKGLFKNISIMSAYAPTEDAEDDVKDVFYDLVEEEWRKLPGYDTKLIMGDFNAKIGREQTWMEVAGLNSLHIDSNDNGVRLLSLATACNLRVKSTFFPRKDIHKVTWISPNGRIGNQIDHVLIDHRHSSHVTNVRSIRKAECGSDHSLVLVNLYQRIKIEKSKVRQTTVNVEVEKLRDREVERKFRLELSNRFQALEEKEPESGRENTVEKDWTNMKKIVQECAEEVCGKKERKNKKPWFDEECRDAVAKRGEAKETWLNSKQEANWLNYQERSRKMVKLLRKKKRDWIGKILEKAEQDRTANNSKEFYRSLRFFKKGYTPSPVGIKDKRGKLVIQKDEGLTIWREYFRELLNGDIQEEEGGEEVYQNVQPWVPEPVTQEVVEAIKGLKNNKAPGGDGITAELLKAGGLGLAERIHKLILKVWREETTPKEWKEALVVPIHKKGDKKECNNYRGISLLNCTYKILSIIIKRRLEEYTGEIIGEHQAGFSRGRSTTDQIFILKESIAKYYEFNKSFCCLFVDFRKAYDSINREKLWENMDKFGIPRKIIKLAKLSVIGSKCKVKVDGEISEDFEVNTGVRQGDGISPLLFNLALETALQEVRNTEIGIKVGTNINVLAFADDIVLIAPEVEQLKNLTKIMIDHTKKMGLQINEEKTKLMECGRRQNGDQQANQNHIEIEGFKFQRVTQFQYLGVILTNNNNEDIEILNRLKLAQKSFSACHKLLSSKILSRTTKLRIYKTIIRPVLMYGSESWVLSKKTERKIIVFENKILRKVYGPTYEDGQWRKKHNWELRGLFREPDIVAEVRSRRMRWAGHVIRKEKSSLPSKVIENNPEGSRPLGRPKLRWGDQLGKDLRRLGRKKEDAGDREEWRKCVGEAKYQLGYQWPQQ